MLSAIVGKFDSISRLTRRSFIRELLRARTGSLERPPRARRSSRLNSVCGIVGLCLAFTAGVARADDWPQWLGPQRDDVWRETGIVEKLPESGPPVRWRTPIGAGYAGPAVADGRVYLMDRVVDKGAKIPKSPFEKGAIPGKERVLCLDAANGKILWTHAYDCTYAISYPSGPRTTPVVRDQRVYALGAMGNLLCLDAADGKPLWSHDFKAEYKAEPPLWGYAAHPLLDGQRLICMVGGEGSTVVAFDKDTGKELWRALTCKQIGYCPPMIYEVGGKRQLIIWHGEAVNGLDPETGKVYWTQPFESFMAMTISTPRFFDQDLFLTSTSGKSAMLQLAADQSKATVLWKGDPKKTSFDSVFGTPFVQDGYIYGTAAIGELRCIEAATGKRVWSSLKPNGGKAKQSADIFIVKNGDRFFLFTEAGDLIIAHLSPKGYEEISRAHLLEPTTDAFGRLVVWSHPAFANRCIFARNDKEIICASLAEPKTPR
jgi:outer membrane protein assembly factor BamB